MNTGIIVLIVIIVIILAIVGSAFAMPCTFCKDYGTDDAPWYSFLCFKGDDFDPEKAECDWAPTDTDEYTPLSPPPPPPTEPEYTPVDVTTYRRYPDVSFSIESNWDDYGGEDSYEKITLEKEDGESDRDFAYRCAENCNHKTVDDSQCRVFAIYNEGQQCDYYQADVKKFGSFKKNATVGTQVYRHVGSSNDKACADHIAQEEGDSWWGFRKGRETPKTHYKWACKSSSNPPASCEKAPGVCFK